MSQEIGGYLRKILEDKKMSQIELSKKSGISASTISRLVSGERGKRPSYSMFQRLAEGLGVPVVDILSHSGWSYDDFLASEQKKYPIVAGIDTKTLPPLTAKDERDIEKDLEEMINNLNSKDGMAGYNQIEDEEDLELLKSSLLTSMKLARQIAKKKFTPKKYRK